MEIVACRMTAGKHPAVQPQASGHVSPGHIEREIKTVTEIVIVIVIVIVQVIVIVMASLI